MRVFSNLEKQLVRKIIELDDKVDSLNTLGNIIAPFDNATCLPNCCYIELKSENDVTIQVKKSILDQKGVDWIKSIDKGISKKLITVIALFQYLENEKLAYFAGDLHPENLGEMWADTEYTRCEFLDDDLKPLIFKYSKKKVFVSETLRLLEANGFKTDEELRHEAELVSIGKQLKFTRIALMFSILGLAISVIVPIFVTSSIEIKNSEISNTQATLTAIENQLRRMNEIDNLSSVMTERLESAVLSIQKSIDRIASILSEPHNKEIQPTAEDGS